MHRIDDLPPDAAGTWKGIGAALTKGDFDGAARFVLDPALHLAGLDAGTVLTAVIFVACVAVVIYYPMVRWRRILVAAKEQLEDEGARRKAELLQLTEQPAAAGEIERVGAEVAEIEGALKRLAGQRVWPNGDKAAGAFFSIIGACAACTISPVLSPIGFLAGLAAKIWPRLTSKEVLSPWAGGD